MGGDSAGLEALVGMLPTERVRIETRRGAWPAGAGQRGLRNWFAQAPCCSAPGLVVHPDGRRGCGSCGEWGSASHSDGVLALARAEHPIGIDVQLPRRRAGAMRTLAAVSGVSAPGMGHWALAEATLKALGQAGARPRHLPLPQELTGDLCWDAVSGEQLEGVVVDLSDAHPVPSGTALAVVRLVERNWDVSGLSSNGTVSHV